MRISAGSGFTLRQAKWPGTYLQGRSSLASFVHKSYRQSVSFVPGCVHVHIHSYSV